MKCKKSEEEVQELEKEANEKCTMPTDSVALSTAERRTGAVMVDWAPRSGGASRAPHCPNSPRAVRRSQLAYRRPSTVSKSRRGAVSASLLPFASGCRASGSVLDP